VHSNILAETSAYYRVFPYKKKTGVEGIKMELKNEHLPQISYPIHENPYFLKKIEKIFHPPPLVLHGFIKKVGKNIAFL
jgi:hypothetical protein